MNVDYTKYEPGMAVSAAGLIIKCPKCGRNGEQRKGTKKLSMRVIHAAQIVAHIPAPSPIKGKPGAYRAKKRTKLQATDRCDIKLGEFGT